MDANLEFIVLVVSVLERFIIFVCIWAIADNTGKILEILKKDKKGGEQ